VLDPVALRRESLLAGLLAAAGAVAVLALAPPGVDLAAHAYQRTLFLAHGFTLWNNFWYAGRYSFVGYSLVYYPLAALFGTKVLAVLSAGVAAAAFAVLVCGEWGSSARASSFAFAAVWPAIILAAAFPFALGAALAMMAVWSLQTERTRSFAVFTVLTLAASPLAFVILIVVSLGIAAGQRPERARMFGPVAVLVAVAISQFVVMRLFPSYGAFPFTLFELIPALIFSTAGLALTYRVPRARPLHGFFGAYGVVCVLSFVIPSSLGSNIERVRYAAIPLALLVLALRRRTPRILSVGVLVLAAAWNLTPAVSALSRSSVDDNQRYWAPAITFLHAHLSPSYRVEVVDTADHWAAAYLPDAQIPIARGWFRQDDFPQNELLYDRPIARGAYLTWLRSLSVRYVLLTDAPTDYSSRAESRLIRSGQSGLREIRRLGHFTVYTVPRPRPLVTGPAPASVLQLGPSQLIISIAARGRYHLAVKWSPYWSAAGSCIQKTRNGQMNLSVKHRGIVTVRFSVNLKRGLETFIGSTPTRQCAPE
jgi:hypothetical protein